MYLLGSASAFLDTKQRRVQIYLNFTFAVYLVYNFLQDFFFQSFAKSEYNTALHIYLFVALTGNFDKA